MKTQYKLKEHVTRGWLVNTKWDVQSWSKKKIQFWCDACVALNGELGLESDSLRKAHYYLLKGTYIFSLQQDTFNCSDEELKTFEDMFEPIEQSTTTPLPPSEAVVPKKEYTWVKAEYKLASEALKAFEGGVELYIGVASELGTEYELITTKRDFLNELIEEETLYTKVVTPWYELVSEEKPCYVTSTNNTGQFKIRKMFKCTKLVSHHFNPLTQC